MKRLLSLKDSSRCLSRFAVTMPSLTLPSVPRYVPPPLTKESCMYLFSFSITGYTTVVITVEYADLAFIDFSKLGTPEGRAELATQVRDALSVQGFFYVINHGLTQAQVCSMLVTKKTLSVLCLAVERADFRHWRCAVYSSVGRGEASVSIKNQRDGIIPRVQIPTVLGLWSIQRLVIRLFMEIIAG